jgi:hypothetical protein
MNLTILLTLSLPEGGGELIAPEPRLRYFFGATISVMRATVVSPE